MLPTITIGSLTISLYWTMFCVGVIAMGVLMVRRRKKLGLSLFGAIMTTVVTAVFGFVGAKLFAVLLNFEIARTQGLAAAGKTFIGALYMVPIGMLLFARLFKLTKKQMLDAVAPCMAVFVAFQRVGCFLHGCCGGLPVTVAGITLRWPTQMMESIGDFLVLGLLLQLEETHTFEGKRYAVFLGGYGIVRFAVDFLRDADRGLPGLTEGQLLSVPAILIGVVGLMIHRRNCNKQRKRGSR